MNFLSTSQLILGTGILSLTGNVLFVNGINTNIQSISVVSGNFNIIPTNYTYLINTLQTGVSGIYIGVTGTFPNASGLMGYQFTIKDWKGNSTTNLITLTGTNNQTFDGSPNFIMNQNYSSFNFISDNQNWCMV